MHRFPKSGIFQVKVELYLQECLDIHEICGSFTFCLISRISAVYTYLIKSYIHDYRPFIHS